MDPLVLLATATGMNRRQQRTLLLSIHAVALANESDKGEWCCGRVSRLVPWLGKGLDAVVGFKR
jgi:hypothetical protein